MTLYYYVIYYYTIFVYYAISAGLNPAIPGCAGRCFTHWATRPIDASSFAVPSGRNDVIFIGSVDLILSIGKNPASI